MYQHYDSVLAGQAAAGEGSAPDELRDASVFRLSYADLELTAAAAAAAARGGGSGSSCGSSAGGAVSSGGGGGGEEEEVRRSAVMDALLTFLGVDVPARPLRLLKETQKQTTQPLSTSINNYEELRFAFCCQEPERSWFE